MPTLNRHANIVPQAIGQLRGLSFASFAGIRARVSNRQLGSLGAAEEP